MIKRWGFLLLLIAIAVWAFFFRQQPPTETYTPPTTHTKEKVPVYNGRKVIGLKETEVNPDKIKISNHISPDWKEKVTEGLKAQGGEDLKEINIEKVESLIVVQDGRALNAESVKVILKNQKGEESSFRALVDSQTGKILESWDRPVIDPANPRQEFGLKVDPRNYE